MFAALALYPVVTGRAHFSLVNLADEGVAGTATVTGPDPAGHGSVDIVYTVAGKTYRGTAPHGGSPADFNPAPGDEIAIVYARSDPLTYCTCDPKGAFDYYGAGLFVAGGAFMIAGLLLTGLYVLSRLRALMPRVLRDLVG